MLNTIVVVCLYFSLAITPAIAAIAIGSLIFRKTDRWLAVATLLTSLPTWGIFLALRFRLIGPEPPLESTDIAVVISNAIMIASIVSSYFILGAAFGIFSLILCIVLLGRFMLAKPVASGN